MEDNALMELWKSYDQRLEEARVLNLQSWVVNMQTFEYLQKHKMQTRLNSLANFKIWMVVLGMAWVLLLSVLVYGNQFRNPYFTVSVGLIILFNIYAIAMYIRQVVMIRRIDYGQPVTEVQRQLVGLQASTVKVVRVLFLQTPFYGTRFWHKSWIHYDSWNFWLITFPITLFLVLIAIWLYRNISLRNAQKRWFRILMGTKEWTSIVKAMDDLKEIDEFRQR